ncbi:MAG: hypothetical protein MZU95_12030 [Desulfomicrobium escambiense]|nr:hypothetical protein [Desulfomicrobium escambiense]
MRQYRERLGKAIMHTGIQFIERLKGKRHLLSGNGKTDLGVLEEQMKVFDAQPGMENI